MQGRAGVRMASHIKQAPMLGVFNSLTHIAHTFYEELKECFVKKQRKLKLTCPKAWVESAKHATMMQVKKKDGAKSKLGGAVELSADSSAQRPYNLEELEAFLESKGCELNSKCTHKTTKAEFTVKSINLKEISLTHAEGIVKTTPSEIFKNYTVVSCKKEYTIGTWDYGLGQHENYQVELECSRWRIMLDDLHSKQLKVLKKISVHVTGHARIPKTNAAIKAGELWLVPTCISISVTKDNEEAPLASLKLAAYSHGGGRSVYARPVFVHSQNPTETRQDVPLKRNADNFVSLFWIANTTPCREDANLQLVWKGYEKAQIPVLVNDAHIDAGTELLFYRPKIAAAKYVMYEDACSDASAATRANK